MTTTATAPPTMAGVDILSTQYLLAGLPRIPRGDVTLLFGEGAAGKGRLIWSWVAEVINTDPGAVVLVILPEDHPNEAVAPRLRDAGVSDPSRVINLTRLPNGSRFKLSADLTHAGHLGLLREYITDITAARPGLQVRMIVLDPLASVVGWGSIQTNAGARRLLEPLQDLCMGTGIAGVVVAHTVTGGKLQGSLGLSQAARTVYKVSRDPVDPAVRILSVDKANNLPDTEDLRFTIEGDDAGHVRVVMVDGAEASRRQRQWREPRSEPVPAAPPVPDPAREQQPPPPAREQQPAKRSPLHLVANRPASPAVRRDMIAGILSVPCKDTCSRPNAVGCDLRMDRESIIPLSMSPPLGAHESRVLDAALAGAIDLDAVLAAVA